jgi:OOP family OmpA-OmpF porin
MKKPIRPAIALAALASAACLVATPARAQGYMGVSIGEARASLDCGGATLCDKTDTAYKVFAGFMSTPNFGIELGYNDLGKARLGDATSSTDFRGYDFGVYGLLVAPFDRLSVFGKLGVVATRIKGKTASIVPPVTERTETHTDLGWGLGAGYEFSRKVGVRAEFARTRAEFQGQTRDVDLFSVGVLYRF